MNQSTALLDVCDLETSVMTSHGRIKVVDGVSFSLKKGETLGLVGESGCGKTMTCLTILGLLPKHGAKVTAGRIIFEGVDLVQLSAAKLRAIRGRKISMILQDSLTSLNPVFTVGTQLAEAVSLHQGLRGRALHRRVIEALELVRIPDAETHVNDYPHKLSGGMRQRVAGAIALAGRPSLLIADEPTTALDLTIQAQYLDLLQEIQRRTGMSIIFVTHDFGVVARMCDRVAIMYAGKIVESGSTRDIFDDPRHPYTRALLGCLPRVESTTHDLVSIDGQPPDFFALPTGCRFAARCTKAIDMCREHPAERFVNADHRVSCWRDEE